jgi:hypothetical protein
MKEWNLNKTIQFLRTGIRSLDVVTYRATMIQHSTLDSFSTRQIHLALRRKDKCVTGRGKLHEFLPCAAWRLRVWNLVLPVTLHSATLHIEQGNQYPYNLYVFPGQLWDTVKHDVFKLYGVVTISTSGTKRFANRVWTML